ncbi:MAG: heme-binding domain-containing protein [Chlorobiaceae bacterium]|nr:heme-binding domain-containing protein [Chlorobiaceae bacterium]NTW10592.1 heme-binding domain-containing protein [Chlorobiaceae bacterium]
MNLSIKSIASWTVFLLMLMQLVPLNRINPPVTGDIAALPEVKNALKKACYDCHSNETKWQGIAYVAPFSWLPALVVNAGRNKLNFSVWKDEKGVKHPGSNPEILDYVPQEGRHYWYYYLWNPSAKLSQRDRDLLTTWLGSFEKEQTARIKN